MSTRAARNQRAYRARNTERREYLKELVEKEVNVNVTLTNYGTIRIDYDMSKEAHDRLEEFCADRGYDLNSLLEDLNRECMARAVKEGRRKMSK